MHRIALFFVYFIFIHGPAANAQSKPIQCLEVLDNNLRLSCFDTFFAYKIQDLWQNSIEKSPIDGRETYFALQTQEKSSLMISCKDNKAAIIFRFGTILREEKYPLTIRLDDGPVETIQVDRSSNYEAVGIWTQQTASLYLNRFTNKRQLHIRLVDRNGNSTEKTFSLSGVSPHISEIKRICKI